MIYTCTTNPSLDYYIAIDELVPGADLRSTSEMYDAGGKGVNVSIVLNNFRIPSVCLGFLGGFTKDYYLSYLSNYPNIQPLFTTIKDNTRINLKIMDSYKETDINAKGPSISNEEFEKFTNRLVNIYEGDYFVLSGSIEEEIQDKIVEVSKSLSNDKVKVVIDTHRDMLDRLIEVKPFMVKLNRNMLKDDDLFEFKTLLLEKGVSNVLYSSPNEPSYIFTEECTYVCESLKDSLINVTGASDSMVAGYLYGLIRGADSEESFKYANAASLATCISNDLGSKEKIEELYDTIEVKKI